MDKEKSADSSDEHVMRALNRIREAFESESPASADDALEVLRERLFEFRPSETSNDAEVRGAEVVDFGSTHEHSSRVDAVLYWLRGTKGFRESELELARRAGVLVESSDGRVILRDQPLPDAWASIMVAGISLLTGAWIAWVCFATEGSPEVILASFVIGSFFGAAVGKALDKSFRFAKLRAKILSAAPHLEEGVRVRF
jgi:hypothetical protein